MIIKGQFEKRNANGSGYGGKEFCYFSEIDLQVGDIVEVPTKNGDAVFLVKEINVPESEIESFKDSMKSVISKKVITNQEYYRDLPSGELLEIALDHICDLCDKKCNGAHCNEALALWLEMEH